MTTPFKRFAAFAELTRAERSALQDLPGPPFSFAPSQVIRHEQDPVDGVYFLHEGWAMTSASFADGDRQILKIHLPGDIMGAPSLALDRAAETITAVTQVVASKVPGQKLGEIFARRPRLALLFFLAAQEERVALMDRLLVMGRRSAKESLAFLLLNLHDQLSKPDADGMRSFDLPLNQSEIADLLGIHVVHVNRMFRALESDGLITRSGKRITLTDPAKLQALTGLPKRRLARNIPWLPIDPIP